MAILDGFKPKDDISLINYEELEARFNIHKYYPKYFHNEGISTPDIKGMIYDKPIYAKANEHVEDWVNPGVMKIYETELDLDSGKLKIRKERKEQKKQRQKEREDRREDIKERREERREERQERREDRKESRDERKEARKEQRQERKQTSEETTRTSKRDRKREKLNNKKLLENRRRLIESKERPMISFNNPWDKKDSLMIYENQVSSRFDDESRKNSITSKLISLVSNNSDDYKILKIDSFDQTKSALTSKRKKSLFKKRYSDQIGTYY